MDFKQFNTGKDDINRRIDKVIRLFAEDLSLGEIYKAIRKGLIKINNKKTKAEYRIQENDIVYIADFLLKKQVKNQAETITENKIFEKKSYKMPEIIFENENILIINKPYDVNVHGDENSLDKIIESYYNSRHKKDSLSFKPGPVHRLDRKTTGLLAFSMSLEGGQWFAENIKNHNIQKKYYGLVEGNLSKKEIWEDLISNNEDAKGTSFHKVTARKLNHDEVNHLEQNTQEVNQKEKIAKTIATPLEHGKYNGKDYTLVEFHIKTGRKHQIRAQSSLHHHPLAGDTAYGGTKMPIGHQDFYLTARELIIPKENPIGLPENIKAMLPNDFIDVLKRCDIKKTVV